MSNRPIFLSRTEQRKAAIIRILPFVIAGIIYAGCLIFTVCELAQPLSALIRGKA